MNKDAEKAHLKDLDPMIGAACKDVLDILPEMEKRYDAMTPEELMEEIAACDAIDAENMAILERDSERRSLKSEYFVAGLDKPVFVGPDEEIEDSSGFIEDQHSWLRGGDFAAARNI